jgi:hypothetical protein
LAFSLSGGDSDEQTRDLNPTRTPSSVNLKSLACALILLRAMAINFDVPAVRSTSVTFTLIPLVFASSYSW